MTDKLLKETFKNNVNILAALSLTVSGSPPVCRNTHTNSHLEWGLIGHGPEGSKEITRSIKFCSK